MKVYAVTVFESGDLSTSVWGVFDSEEKAKKLKEDLMNNTTLNSNGYYLDIEISEHEVY